MKKIIVFFAFYFLVVCAHAQDDLLGRWKDKNDPDLYQYEFRRNNEFIYKYSWKDQGQTQINEVKGAWKIGGWVIKRSGAISDTCRLKVFAGPMECCFDFEFISNNLIMKNKYSSNSYGGMCENRVLIKRE